MNSEQQDVGFNQIKYSVYRQQSNTEIFYMHPTVSKIGRTCIKTQSSMMHCDR